MRIASSVTTNTHPPDGHKMRKRKRGYGQYQDDETGEVTTVLTTKEVKRNHQKSGKWYKEPTEAEIRAWDREEQRQNAADKAAKREENKKINAAKRAEKEAKEVDVKKQLFEAGKITFTQTLAKKDEDQTNLHSWFGGKLKSANISQVGAKDTLKSTDKQSACGDGQRTPTRDDCRSASPANISHASQQSDFCEVADDDLQELLRVDPLLTAEFTMDSLAELREPLEEQAMDQPRAEHKLDGCAHDFDVAEDAHTANELLGTVSEHTERETEPDFKVPGLPASRLPLSPMSKSEINVRHGNTTNMSCFKKKSLKTSVRVPSSTQAFMFGLSTQELAVDLDDDDSPSEDKENKPPGDKDVKLGSPCQRIKLPPTDEDIKKVDTGQHNVSFMSESDSFYCKAFDNHEFDVSTGHDKFSASDDVFDDKDFESLPFTQLTSSIKPPQTIPQATTNTPSSNQVLTPKTCIEKRPFQKCESYPLPQGISEDDLFEALEQSQKQSTPASYAASIQARSSSMLAKKKRILPWQAPGYELHSGVPKEDDDEISGGNDSQSTELLSSSA